MSSNEDLSLVIIGDPKNLNLALAKEFKVEGLRIHTQKQQNAAYKVVLIDASDPQSDRSKIVQNLTPDNQNQKIIAVLVADSFLSSKQIESQLLLISLKQGEEGINLRTIVVFDLYDPGGKNSVSHFEEWLCQIYREQKIQTSKKGNFPLFPTSLADLGKMIIKALFSQNTKGQLYCLAGESISDLDLALSIKNELEKLGRTLDLDASLDKEAGYLHKDDIVHSQAKLNLIPKDQICDHLSLLLKKCQQEQVTFTVQYSPLKLKKEKPIDEESLSLKNTEKRGVANLAKYLAAFLMTIIVTPTLLFSLFITLNSRYLYQSYQQFRSSDPVKARQTLKVAKRFHAWSSVWFQTSVPFTNIISSQATKEINNYLLLLDHSGQFLQDVYDSYALSDHYYQGLIGKTQSNDQSLSALRLSLDNLLDNLSQIQLLISQAKLPFGIKTKIQSDEFPEQIKTLKSQLYIGTNLTDLLLAISKQTNPLKIILLVQDETELRGSGGYMNTIVSLTINKNKIQTYQVEPALNVDRLIDGRVEPPVIINQALGQNTWFFRDSNINGSFSEVGPQVSWFYNRFKQSPVQAVIAINSRLLQDILKWTGPISINSGQTVNSDNLPILLSTITTDPNLDVLTNLTDHILAKIISGNLNFIPLARSVAQSIQDQNISVWFADKSLQSLLPDELTQTPFVKPCHAQLSVHSCQQETIYLNENNFSVAKLNAYLKREQQHQITIGKDGTISYLLSFNYSYPVPAPNNLNQNYNAYYQLYLSKGSIISKVSLDEQEVDKQLITSTPYNDLTRLELYLPQSINQNHRLTFEITSAQKLDMTKANIPFSLNLLKQPGTKDILNLTIQYPSNISPKNITAKLTSSPTNSLVANFSSIPQQPIGILFRNLEL